MSCRVLSNCRCEIVKPTNTIYTSRKPPELNPDAAAKKLAKAMEERYAERAKIGTGVSDEAQAIFDALCKTMPCRWEKDSIIVFDSIRIVAPYTRDQCSVIPGSSGGGAKSLERIKLVVCGKGRRGDGSCRAR